MGGKRDIIMDLYCKRNSLKLTIADLCKKKTRTLVTTARDAFLLAMRSFLLPGASAVHSLVASLSVSKHGT